MTLRQGYPTQTSPASQERLALYRMSWLATKK